MKTFGTMKKFLLLIELLLLVFMVKAQNAEYSFKETYDAPSKSNLTVDAEDSDIKIMASDMDHIAIFYIVRQHNKLLHMNRDELEEYFKITITKEPDGLTIKSRSKEKNNLTNWENRIMLDFKVLAPIETHCSLSTVDGDLAIKGFKSDQEYKTVDGDIKILNITGNITASTVDGDIHIEETEGKVEAKTTDGDIKIKNLTSDIKATTTDGDISFTGLTGGIQCATSDGDVNGHIIDLKSACGFRTGDGDINISLTQNTGFNVTMKGEDLKVNFKNFNGDVDDDYIKGQVNGGGPDMNLSTTDGDIHISFE